MTAAPAAPRNTRRVVFLASTEPSIAGIGILAYPYPFMADLAVKCFLPIRSVRGIFKTVNEFLPFEFLYR